jgi:hypothetical protein
MEPVTESRSSKPSKDNSYDADRSLDVLDTVPPEEAILVQPIEGAETLNLVLSDFDGYVKEWKELTDPILQSRDEAFKLCEIDEFKLANIKHVIIGSFLSYMVNGATLEFVKKHVTFKKQSPFIDVSLEIEQKYKEIFEKVKEWIIQYWQVIDKVAPLYKKIMEIPLKATNACSTA